MALTHAVPLSLSFLICPMGILSVLTTGEGNRWMMEGQDLSRPGSQWLVMDTTPSVHADTQPTRRVLSLAAIPSAPALSLAATPQDTEWPGPDSAESTHKHILAHTSQQVPRAGSTRDWHPGSRVPLDTQHLVAVTAHGNTPTAAPTARRIHPSHTCPLSCPAPYLRANSSHLKVVEGAYRVGAPSSALEHT